MPFPTYNEATPFLTTDRNIYRWQQSNNQCSNKVPTITTTLPPLSLETPKHNNSNSPSLSDRLAYVEALVDMNAMVIEAIWPSNNGNSNSSTSNIVPLRSFIQEVLKRSRTTYSTLQTAFFYLFRARPAIVQYLQTTSSLAAATVGTTTPLSGRDAYIHCGRRMFLASLVVASKFVQDKTYRNSVWAKIAGLPVQEINASERVFLGLLDYRLYVAQPTFDQWHQLLHAHVQAKTASSKNGSFTDNSNNNNNSPLFQSVSPSQSPQSSPSITSLLRSRPYPTPLSSSSSSLPFPINPANDTSLPPLRPLSALQGSSSSSSTTTPSLSSLLSAPTASTSSTLPALSPSSIASTSSSTCSPILNHTPPILATVNTSVTNRKRRLLHEHDITPSYQPYRPQQQERKRPCNSWHTSSTPF
ncbi:hypothetical protein [Absidia glauca]|uniref:Cyclin N-terminal domain-containing protein n=1 Tax=Absidia glauca TaxID=4829 RepID=A0A163K485_ABSGL|nr:hypothetical protein [Absidia glauca]